MELFCCHFVNVSVLLLLATISLFLLYSLFVATVLLTLAFTLFILASIFLNLAISILLPSPFSLMLFVYLAAFSYSLVI